MKVGLDKVPNGGGAYVSLASRASASGNEAYRAKVRVAADGRVSLFLVRTISGVQTDIATPVVLPTSANYAVGDRLQLRLQAEGSSPTTVRAKVWKVGFGGAVGLAAHGDRQHGRAAGRGGCRRGDLSLRRQHQPPGRRQVRRPRRHRHRSPDRRRRERGADCGVHVVGVGFVGGVHLDVVGCGRVDRVVCVGVRGRYDEHASNPSKTYASAGTYSVRLTVTDDDGASDSVTNPVTVDDGGGVPGAALASDDFSRSVGNGWGSAPTGGTWSLVGGHRVVQRVGRRRRDEHGFRGWRGACDAGLGWPRRTWTRR